MAITYAEGKRTVAARTKVLVAVLAGMAVCATLWRLVSWKILPLAGWDTVALVFVAWTWLTVWGMNGELTQRFALREDPSRYAADAGVLVASLFSLFAVGLVLFDSGASQGAGKFLQALLGVASVVLSWVLVHTVFTLRYAEMYYTNPLGGVMFGDTKQPSYKDFAYLAFTLGMTFQVSDTTILAARFRHVVLRHALVSYLFGTIILATTINLIAGLGK